MAVKNYEIDYSLFTEEEATKVQNILTDITKGVDNIVIECDEDDLATEYPNCYTYLKEK